MIWKNKALLIFLLFCLLVFVLDKRGVFYGVKNSAEMVVVPVQSGVAEVKRDVLDLWRTLIFWRSGEERIKDLERKNWELVAKLKEFDEIKKENIGLRGQLRIADVVPEAKILAKVISFGDYLVVDAGEAAGVGSGAVAVWEDFLIGVVTKTTPRRSFILLPTSNRSAIPVKANATRGVAVGQFAATIILDKVNQEDALVEGGLVLTSGEDPVFKTNLIVGTVGKIVSRESEIYKKAQIVPTVNYQKLEQVLILLDK